MEQESDSFNISPKGPMRRKSRSFDLGDLRKTIENMREDNVTRNKYIEKMKKHLISLLEKRDQIQESLKLAEQGYNDVGININELQQNLSQLQQQIKELEDLLKDVAPKSYFFNTTENSDKSFIKALSSNNTTEISSFLSTRKFTLQLKKELSPLDPRIEVYTSFVKKIKKKQVIWTLNEKDQLEIDECEKKKFEAIKEILQTKSYIIEEKDLVISDEKLGEGDTCKIFKAKLWGTYDVVIKKFKNKEINEKNLIREITRIHSMPHRNIVMFYGICVKPFYLVMEYIVKGTSLFNMIHNHHISFEMPLFIKLARDLALGISHLHYQIKILHRELDTHHILIDENKNIKISIKYLTRISENMTNSIINSNHLRWRAPEITKGLTNYSGKVDVYSYGLILWEMLSGNIPFRKLDNITAAAKAAYEGMRPNIPASCPPIIRQLILRCWHPDPEMRPSLHEILKFFSHIEGKLFFSSRGNLWTLDKEQEMERERKRQEKYLEIVGFLKTRDFLIDLDEITIGEKIGSGAFAKVYEGTWKGYRIALKKLKNTNITEKFFLREISNLQKSHHPNVVLFLGSCAQPPCIVTEFMAGGSLFDALHTHNIKLDLMMMLKMSKDIAEGMRHLHNLNILHRDLTSKNILLDEFQNVKISDFGLSREVGSEMSLAGICSPRWRPPEITKGELYDGKADVYCFGLIMYEMISGQIPFEKFDGVTAAAKSAYENLRPTIPDSCPEQLSSLIKLCWHEDPNQRPTFCSILEELENIKKSILEKEKQNITIKKPTLFAMDND